MVNLSDKYFLASGGARDVYSHPCNDNLCLKHQRVKGDQNLNEMNFFKRAAFTKYTPEFHGVVKSNLGSCLVFELIRDYDGLVSKSLKYYAENGIITKEMALSFIELISEYFLTKNYLIHDGGIQNILLKKKATNQFEPILVDGFGAKRNDIKNRLRIIIPCFGKNKTIKQINIMKKSISNIYLR